MNTVQIHYVLQDRRKSVVLRILKGAIGWSEFDMKRIQEYCELSFKRGYYAGQAASAKKLRDLTIPPAITSMADWKHFSITSDQEVAIDCPLCGKTVPPSTTHEHRH